MTIVLVTNLLLHMLEQWTLRYIPYVYHCSISFPIIDSKVMHNIRLTLYYYIELDGNVNTRHPIKIYARITVFRVLVM